MDKPIYIIDVVREQDKHGSGKYGAPRGKRKHRGVDYAFGVCPGITGMVTKIGWVYYNWNYRYVEVTDKNGYRHRYFYIEPKVSKGERVNVMTLIGIHQDLGQRYPGITPHIHKEIIAPDGTYINPAEYDENFPG